MKKNLNKDLQGKCVGLVNGEVVLTSTSIRKVMDALIKQYPNEQISITSVPKENKVFIL